jgi:hypothetical protein
VITKILISDKQQQSQFLNEEKRDAKRSQGKDIR